MIFLWYNIATAENALPPCQGEDHMQWTNCFGAYLKKDLKRDGLTRDFTGEFGSSPGKREGKGTGAVYKNGNLLLAVYLCLCLIAAYFLMIIVDTILNGRRNYAT